MGPSMEWRENFVNQISGEGCEQLIPLEDLRPVEAIERSLITEYRKVLWGKFIKGIKEFKLIGSGDRIAVAISGGKDSLVMAKLFQELKRHGIDNFELEFIAMDPGYHPSIRKLLIDNCNHLNIPVEIFDVPVFKVAEDRSKEYPCFLCAKMRRGALYERAQTLNCNKLALGHHFNDVIETTMLNVFYTGNFKTMLPKLKAQNFHHMELIRPLYYIAEQDIQSFIQHSGIWPLNCACMVAAKKIGSKRHEIKALIEQLKGSFKDLDKMIFRAAQNVNMDCILGWKQGGIQYSYLDFYDQIDTDEME